MGNEACIGFVSFPNLTIRLGVIDLGDRCPSSVWVAFHSRWLV